MFFTHTNCPRRWEKCTHMGNIIFTSLMGKCLHMVACFSNVTSTRLFTPESYEFKDYRASIFLQTRPCENCKGFRKCLLQDLFSFFLFDNPPWPNCFLLFILNSVVPKQVHFHGKPFWLCPTAQLWYCFADNYYMEAISGQDVRLWSNRRASHKAC